MKRQECARCSNPYYSAANESKMPCPYCGFASIAAYEDKRGAKRDITHDHCDLMKGDVRVPVRLMDISRDGLGIRMKGYLPFDEDDTVRIYIRKSKMEKSARIVWAKKIYGISKAGLKFC
ncbi:MAG: PilZ domain-containing protein [Thermodesulfobacteriota bacterium]